MIKVISFDLDGTLLDKEQFDDVFWFYEVPHLYAKQYGMSFEEAKSLVVSEYKAKGEEHLDWYRPRFWFKHFKLNAHWDFVIRSMRHKIRLYPEVKETLKELSKDYKLIVITNTAHEFLEIKVKAEGLQKYFSKIISTVDDLNAAKRHSNAYPLVLKKVKIKPEEILHVGDSYDDDYLAAKKAGMNALYLDRKEDGKGGKDNIKSLKGIFWRLEQKA